MPRQKPHSRSLTSLCFTFLLVPILALSSIAQINTGEGLDLTPEQIRARLKELDQSLETISVTADYSSWYESTNERVISEPITGSTFSVQSDGTQLRRERNAVANPDENEIYVRQENDIVKMWLQNDYGSGVGKIMRPRHSADIEWAMTPWAMPLKAFRAQWRFDLDSTDFVIEGEVDHDGERSIAIRWEQGEGDSATISRMILSLDHRLTPLYVERRSADGRLEKSAAFGEFHYPPNGPPIPTVVTYKNSVSAKSAQGLPSGIRPEDTVISSQTYSLHDIVVNEKLPDDVFNITWAHGTEIIDEISGVTYYNRDEEFLSVSNALNPDALLDGFSDLAETQRSENNVTPTFDVADENKSDPNSSTGTLAGVSSRYWYWGAPIAVVAAGTLLVWVIIRFQRTNA